jgi:hypothetical protein
MMKKLMLPLIASLFFACQNEPAKEGASNAANPETPSGESPTSDASALENMKGIALEESDTLGRIRQSFIALQEEFEKAKGKVPDVGDVKISVTERFDLVIQNTFGGHVYITKVNIKDLKRKDGGMNLLPDFPPREFPGLKIYVKEGSPNVQRYKDGNLEKEENFIEFYLKDRPSIEKVVPAIVQAMNLANGHPANFNG